MKLRPGGTPVKSLETRWLHQDHAQAVRELREHKQGCMQCQKALRRRQEEPCDEGAAIREAERRLLEQAREADRLDAQPIPGQEALFGEDECRP